MKAIASISRITSYDAATLRAGGPNGYPHVLCSFVYDEARTAFTEKLGYSPSTWMGDSGAFTVWATGDRVDVNAYVEWCKEYRKLNPGFVAVSLDVIPGGPNRKPTAKEQREAIRESLANGDQLRDAGLRIIEVLHLYEPLDHLGALLARRQPGDSIGFGGLAGSAPKADKRAFCDAAFSYLQREHGWASLPPVHGFGIPPTPPLGARYPWHSLDSSAWMTPGRFGGRITRSGHRRGTDARTSNKTLRMMYLARVLERWTRAERDLTQLWERRGVRYAHDTTAR